jgi:hypothetical protein
MRLDRLLAVILGRQDDGKHEYCFLSCLLAVLAWRRQAANHHLPWLAFLSCRLFGGNPPSGPQQPAASPMQCSPLGSAATLDGEAYLKLLMQREVSRVSDCAMLSALDSCSSSRRCSWVLGSVKCHASYGRTCMHACMRGHGHGEAAHFGEAALTWHMHWVQLEPIWQGDLRLEKEIRWR